MNQGTLVTGHPTVAANLQRLGMVANQALAARTAWFIDPIAGRNSNSGATLATAIQTRAEFYRRMSGVTLTQPVTITVTSSLLAGDDFQSTIFTSATNLLQWVGVPTVIFTGAVTAYVARVGATSTTTKMTIAGLTAAGNIGKIIEKSDASIRGVVVRDLGANQAWIAPPLNGTTNAQDAIFVNGDTINVYSLPNFRSLVQDTRRSSYKYLDHTLFQLSGGVADMTSCTGVINQTDGGYSAVNCNVTMTTIARCTILGGITSMVALGAIVQVAAHAVFTRMRLEGTALLTTSGQNSFPGNTPADIEAYVTSATVPFIDQDEVNGGIYTFQGFVYGLSLTLTNLAIFGGRNGLVVFAKQPAVTTAVNANFGLAGITEALSRLSLIELTDKVNNNVIVGPIGAVMTIDRYQLSTQCQGIISQTFDRAAFGNNAVMVDGTIYFCAIPLLAGDVVTNLTIAVSVIGVVLTLSKVGLYDLAGNRLGISADQGASWQTSSAKTIALLAPVTIATSGLYYVAMISKGATPAGLVRGTSGVAATGGWLTPIGAGQSIAGIQTGQTDLVNPATIVFGGTLTFLYWAAAS